MGVTAADIMVLEMMIRNERSPWERNSRTFFRRIRWIGELETLQVQDNINIIHMFVCYLRSKVSAPALLIGRIRRIRQKLEGGSFDPLKECQSRVVGRFLCFAYIFSLDRYIITKSSSFIAAATASPHISAVTTPTP